MISCYVNLFAVTSSFAASQFQNPVYAYSIFVSGVLSVPPSVIILPGDPSTSTGLTASQQQFHPRSNDDVAPQRRYATLSVSALLEGIQINIIFTH